MLEKLPYFVMIADKCKNGFTGEFQKEDSLGEINPYFPEIFSQFLYAETSRHFALGVSSDKGVKFPFYAGYFGGVKSCETAPERTVKRKCHSEIPEIFQGVLRVFKAFFPFSFFGIFRQQRYFIGAERSVFNNAGFYDFYFSVFNNQPDSIPSFGFYAEKFANLLGQCDLTVFFNSAAEYLHKSSLQYDFTRDVCFCQSPLRPGTNSLHSGYGQAPYGKPHTIISDELRGKPTGQSPYGKPTGQGCANA